MKRRQKKVQQFLDALKVGDRVITTGGIYGSITKIGDRSVQVQIADKVRIEISRAAIAGYQGQEPVVPESTSSIAWAQIFAGESFSSSSCSARALGDRPAGQKIRLGLDLKGGVHLVLRVNTDDALASRP